MITTLPEEAGDLNCGLPSCGYLLAEDHLITDQEVGGPANPNFRIAPGDLREAVSGLEILLYEESVEAIPEGGQVASARVVAKNS